jgi:hypothetical protein
MQYAEAGLLKRRPGFSFIAIGAGLSPLSGWVIFAQNSVNWFGNYEMLEYHSM